MEIEFDRLKREFFVVYPSLVSDAAFKQGQMFDRSLYPDVAELEGRFYMRLFITPVPQDDFRSAISDVIADDLKTHYEAQVNTVVQSMVDDIKAQLVSHTTRLRNACVEAQADVDGTTKRKKIYESTVEQARSMIGLLSKFNITDDVELEHARQSLAQTLEGVALSDLRESAAVRAEVREGLDDILSKFAPLTLGGDDE